MDGLNGVTSTAQAVRALEAEVAALRNAHKLISTELSYLQNEEQMILQAVREGEGEEASAHHHVEPLTLPPQLGEEPDCREEQDEIEDEGEDEDVAMELERGLEMEQQQQQQRQCGSAVDDDSGHGAVMSDVHQQPG